MNAFLLISGRRGSRSVDITQVKFVLPVMFFMLLLSVLLVLSGFVIGRDAASEAQQSGMGKWYSSLLESREDIKRLSRQATDDIDALALRLGQMEARSIRLDALGSRLVDVAGLEAGEFNFTEAPAIGGPSGGAFFANSQLPDLLDRFAELQRRIDDREHKFHLLESILMDRELESQASPNGLPIRNGWMSSKYGRRSDPFTGKSAWHSGVDFAGKYGSGVVAAASGIVTWSGDKNGYGNLIEISHGNGLITRYGHNSKTLARVGDTVEKGEVIAEMGSSGRSTGPHVHFEVLKDFKSVNPAKYIKSSSMR